MDAGKRISKFLRSEGFHNFKHNPFAIAGAVIIFLFLLTAVFGPHLVSQNPYDLAQLDLNDSYKPRSGRRALIRVSYWALTTRGATWSAR